MTESLKNSTPQNRFLYVVVFTSGMTTLAVELSASRLLGNVFGTSNIIWANVIGLMLLYLTLGYFIGGRWADRSPKRATMYRIIIWASFLCSLIPIVSRPVLQAAATAVSGAEASLALGSFIAILVLFSVPVTLLGTVSPFAIRLAVHSVESAGKVSGQIYAISTVGSIIGTFLPVLFLIPELGTIQTFLLFSGILFTVAMIGLFQEIGINALRLIWMPFVIVALLFVFVSGPLRAAPEGWELLYDGDSAYNYIQVLEDPNGYRYLYLNEGQGIHSQWHPDLIYYGRTWDYFLSAPYFTDTFTPSDMQSALVIGLATGTIARQHIEVYGDIPMVGVEIDPEIIEVGAQFFDMNTEKMPSLTTYAQDGRFILNHIDEKFTLVGIDAYRPPYIPWHLTTVQFFEEVKAHLTDNGVVAVNVGRTDTDRRLVDAIANTLLQVYPTVHAIDVPFSFNTILVATQDPTTTDNLTQNLQQLPSDAHPILRQIMTDSLANIVPTETNDILFTDNRAPVETLVDSLVVNFLLSGGAEAFRE